jgi:4-amino-4-deoxy-L-arabinose transferase-like glycosyltransferase
VLAGTLIGFAFLTKMLQALLVVPGFALVYLFAAPASLRRRVAQLAVGGAALVVSAGWWVAAVALWPASDRPYIGGSQHNSVLELIWGYNGLGRITGNETGSVGGAANGAGRWGATGLTRLFNTEFGGQVGWLVPAALVFLVAIPWFVRRTPRTDERRAQLLLWGSWLVVTGLTFSLARGIIHPYYVVALAPAIGGVIGIGADALWRSRRSPIPHLVLGLAVAATAWWSWVLLARTPTWHPWLRALILVGGLATAAVIGAAALSGRRLHVAVAGAALVTALAGPTAYAVDTAVAPHRGAIPSAGPAVAGGIRGPGGAAGPLGPPPGTQRIGAPGGAGGMGGLLDTSTPSSDLIAVLRTDASSYRWVAATVGSNNAAGIQLATGRPVMSIGGFNGTDPTPSRTAFESMVAAGEVHYFVASGGMGGGPGGGTGPRASQSAVAIATWVEQNFTATTIGGMTVYDLSSSQ